MPGALPNSPALPSRHFEIQAAGAFTVVRFADGSLAERPELDEVERELVHLVDQGHHRIILDLSKIDYMASRPLGVILNLHRKLWRIEGGELVLVGVSPRVLQVLQVTKLDKLLSIKSGVGDVVGK